MRRKLGFIFLISIISFLASGVSGAYAQNKEFFVITGRLTTDDGKGYGSKITITKDGVVQQEVTPPRSGRFRFEFDYNNEFYMTFSKEGYYKKTIIVSTLVPKTVLDENSEFPPFQIEVALVKEIPGIDKSFTNKPAGRVFYNANIDNFDSEVFFSDIQLEEQAQNARSQEQALTAEQREALAQREEDYKKSISDANNLYQQKKYNDALKKYQYAHGLFPDRPYPNDRMSELQDLINALKIAEQRRIANEKPYRDKIAQADDLLMQKKYEEAKQAYSQALELKPNDEYATTQISKTDELIKQQEIDDQYNKLIADAQQQFTSGDYQGARGTYQQALVVKPDQTDFINQQLKKIDDEIAHQAELAQKEKQYNDIMAEGDKAFRREKYDDALSAYQNALSLKPDDQQATSKVNEVQQILLQQQNKANYDQYITDADKAYKNNDLTQAKSLYQEAMKYAPEESYPKDQIAAIDKVIADNQQFDQFVSQAKTALGQQNYDQAKQLFQQALAIRDDGDIRDQIASIDKQLAQIALDKQYADLIKQADDSKTNKDYKTAKSLYNQALTLKKDEEYPKEQIRRIEEEEARLAAQKKLDDQFNEVMANAEKAFNQQDYSKALDGFKSALALKPDNRQAQDRIDATNEMILQLQNRQKYDGLVAEAGDAFKIDSLIQAKSLYQQALSILPDQQLPKDQIALIDQKIKQREEARKAEEARLAALAKEQQRQYDLAVQKGDSLFKLESYDPARQAFQSALSLKPDESYPKNQIAAIEKKQAELARLTTAFNKAIDEADKLAKKENYERAKSKYQEALQYLPDEEYPQKQIDQINNILEQIAAEKQRQENYLAAVKSADSLLNLKSYDAAKASYQKALSIKENEQYPKQKIEAIDGILAQLEKERQEAAKKRQDYENAIKQADQELADKNYDAAKSGYNEALTILPEENYPKDQLVKIDQLIQQEKEDAYKQAIASGDQLFNSEKYSEAQSAYNNALKIKPEDSYAKGQIAKITGILEQMARDELQKQKLEKDYQDKLKNAELAFNNSKFTEAKTLYEQASTIKPDEQYPKDQLAKIDGILAQIKEQQELDQQYTAMVKKAQSSYGAGELEDALNFFKQAAGFKPDEELPKRRIPEIEAEIAKKEGLARLAAEEKARQDSILKAKQDQYDAALASAKVAFENNEYVKAKQFYGDALTVFPDEQYPKDRIAQIDLLIEQQAKEEMARRQQAIQDSIAQATELAFDQKIKQGQQLEDSQNYPDAITSYTEAKNILPDRAGDVDRLIQRVRDKIKAQQELDANYAAAVKQGDGFYDQEDWERSLAAYQEALSYKPEETHPRERVRLITQKLGQLDANYADAVKLADQFFKNNDWLNAKTKYGEALGLKPNEQYPSDQLAIVNQKIQEQQQAQLALEQQEQAYKDAVAIAEKSFVAKNYELAKTQFQSAKRIKPDETYPDERISAIDVLLSQQAADAELARKQQEIDQRYQQAIASADEAFNAKNYDQASSGYQDALEIKPGEQYPQNQLNLIDQLKEQAAAAQKLAEQSEPVAQVANTPVATTVVVDNDYQQFIDNADNSYQQQDYKVAQFYYQKAHQANPAEQYPQDRLKEISKLINNSMSQAELSAYDDAIKQADKAFADQHYSIAKFYYYKALAVKSWEQYPKDQIDQIEDLTNSRLSQMKEQEYKDLIAKADEALINKEYAVARAYYNRSLSIKVDEEYPKIKLKEISNDVEQEKANAENETYQNFVAEGDKAMNAKNYAIARFYYQKALTVKPQETYPTEQLKAIKEALNNASNNIQEEKTGELN